MTLRTLSIVLAIAFSFNSHAQIISTVAGGGTTGLGDGGAATDCELLQPIGIAVDAAGNMYIGDRDNNRIRKVSAATGIITTIAGTGVAGYSGDNGPATDAQINKPYGVAVDKNNNIIFADAYNGRIRKISASGIISTIVGNGIPGFGGDGGMATDAQLSGVCGIAIDNTGNLYITDGITRVRKINIHGIISTIAGGEVTGYSGDNGPATLAKLNYPYAVAVDATANIYI